MKSLAEMGSGLVAARLAAGISQRELGERIGVKQQQIARWETSGYRTASLERLGRVADALEITTASIAAEAAARYGGAAATEQPLVFDYRALARLCREHEVAKLELFGSVLRDDFGADSDVDVLVTYSESARPTLFDVGRLQRELAALFQRHVDVAERRGVEQRQDHIRRTAILESARVIYQA